MHELHVATTAHLRRHNPRYLTPSPPPVPLLDVPHCRYCGKAITAGDDAFDVEQMRAARACVNHFAPF